VGDLNLYVLPPARSTAQTKYFSISFSNMAQI
jgi:hypothetical protein